MNPDQEYVLKTIKSRDVHFVRFWFADVLGQMKSFAVHPDELEQAFEDGMGFDASCIAGLAGEGAEDVLAFPDASTFQILPWRPDSNAVARMFCSLKTPDGEPFAGDSRHVLGRVLAKLHEAGFEANLAPEVEYFYFRDARAPEVLDRGGCFDLTELDSGSDLRRDTVLALENMGIPVACSHHERGPSQHEIDLRASDAASMADAVMTYKMVVKEIAAAHGVYASFMPKPLEGAPGSGMHVQQVLFTGDDRNAFADRQDPQGWGLSPLAKSYIAGLLKYAPQLCLVTNQYVNSYKRLSARGDAPARVGWGRRARNTLVRVPEWREGREAACRIVLRGADPACNPYLAFACTIAAGLAGIQEGLELPECADGKAPGELERLPECLGDAIGPFAQSALAREVLGERVHACLVQAKEREWHEYLRHVSSWELDRWLEAL